jgi:hypothetical protein
MGHRTIRIRLFIISKICNLFTLHPGFHGVVATGSLKAVDTFGMTLLVYNNIDKGAHRRRIGDGPGGGALACPPALSPTSLWRLALLNCKIEAQMERDETMSHRWYISSIL